MGRFDDIARDALRAEDDHATEQHALRNRVDAALGPLNERLAADGRDIARVLTEHGVTVKPLAERLMFPPKGWRLNLYFGGGDELEVAWRLRRDGIWLDRDGRPTHATVTDNDLDSYLRRSPEYRSKFLIPVSGLGSSGFFLTPQLQPVVSDMSRRPLTDALDHAVRAALALPK